MGFCHYLTSPQMLWTLAWFLAEEIMRNIYILLLFFPVAASCLETCVLRFPCLFCLFVCLQLSKTIAYICTKPEVSAGLKGRTQHNLEDHVWIYFFLNCFMVDLHTEKNKQILLVANRQRHSMKNRWLTDEQRVADHCEENKCLFNGQIRQIQYNAVMSFRYLGISVAWVVDVSSIQVPCAPAHWHHHTYSRTSALRRRTWNNPLIHDKEPHSWSVVLFWWTVNFHEHLKPELSAVNWAAERFAACRATVWCLEANMQKKKEEKASFTHPQGEINLCSLHVNMLTECLSFSHTHPDSYTHLAASSEHLGLGVLLS